MILHIVIPFERHIYTDLSIRYTLVDTLEERGVGQVLEEGIGEDGLHVTIQINRDRQKAESSLNSLIMSLGLGVAVINEV